MVGKWNIGIYPFTYEIPQKLTDTKFILQRSCYGIINFEICVNPCILPA